MSARARFGLTALGAVIFMLLFCMQPRWSPDVAASGDLQDRDVSEAFLPVWGPLSWPSRLADNLALILGASIVVVGFPFALSRSWHVRVRAAFIGLTYSVVLLAVWVIYGDGLVPLNGTAATILFVLVVVHAEPEDANLGTKGEPYIRERIATLRHQLNLLFIGATAVGVSAMAFNYAYMQTVYKSPEALAAAQQSVATTTVANLVVFLFWIVPLIYSRLRLMTECLVEFKGAA